MVVWNSVEAEIDREVDIIPVSRAENALDGSHPLRIGEEMASVFKCGPISIDETSSIVGYWAGEL